MVAGKWIVFFSLPPVSRFFFALSRAPAPSPCRRGAPGVPVPTEVANIDGRPRKRETNGGSRETNRRGVRGRGSYFLASLGAKRVREIARVDVDTIYTCAST